MANKEEEAAHLRACVCVCVWVCGCPRGCVVARPLSCAAYAGALKHVKHDLAATMKAEPSTILVLVGGAVTALRLEHEPHSNMVTPAPIGKSVQ